VTAEILEAHDGALEVSNATPQGAVVTFRIPAG
jgi:K+-sensing histidine kinase KdpD